MTYFKFSFLLACVGPPAILALLATIEHFLDNDPIDPLDKQRRTEARRAELTRFASLAPNSTTSIVVQTGQPCSKSDISRLAYKDCEKAASNALGWSTEPGVESKHVPPESLSRD